MSSQLETEPTVEVNHDDGCCSRRRFRYIINHQIFVSLMAGQLLSLLVCGTAVSSQYLEQFKVNVPMLQNVSNYLLLALTYGVISLYKNANSLSKLMRQFGWKYFLAAIIDVEANYVIVMAYQYTSITSVQLIDCLTIPTTLILSRLFFKHVYRATHYIGVVLCLLGVVGMIFADFLSKGSLSFDGKNPVLGDILIAIGAILYGFSNVAQEHLVQRGNKIDYLGWIGFFGSFISSIQMAIFERGQIWTLAGQGYATWLCLAGFALCMYLLYSWMSWVMERSSAVLINLSLLTADVYALLFGVFVFKYSFHVLYFIAYTVIMLGAAIYSVRSVKEHSGEIAIIPKEESPLCPNNTLLTPFSVIPDTAIVENN